MSVMIQSVTKTFGLVKALDNVSVEIKDGEFLAILGPSGCGKTTLLRTIGGFIRPTCGTVEVNGKIFSSENVYLPVEQRNLGMVFQSFALWPHMTVRENIEFPLKSRRNRDISKDERRSAVNTAISSTGLEKMADRLPGELSGGQRQRVALARAIVERPKLLLMDEPLSALDAELKISMRKEIQDIHHLTGATIIYVTHDQSEALAMADRIMIMKDGKIEQIGTPQEIYSSPQTLFAATFVSKCNLVQGEWHKNLFYLRSLVDRPFAEVQVESCFKEIGVCPIRPEEFVIEHDGFGLSGKIVNRQFNGREIHYKVQCENQIHTVYASVFDNYRVGENVILKRRKAYHEIAI